MGKALVIKDVSFATNKLDTITILDNVPCTGISLSVATLSLTAIGSTGTITATVTPLDTTDAVVWTTSDDTVATVTNGVVTQTGVGTAVITATCGQQTASCTVSAVNTFVFAYVIGVYNTKSETSGQDFVVKEAYTNAYCAIYSETPTEKYIKSTGTIFYPIIIGEGANRVSITVPNDIRATVWFVNSTEACDYSASHSDYAVFAKLISGDNSPYDATVSVGNRNVSVPSGADAICISLQKPGSGNTISDSDLESVAIVASKV